VSIPFDIPEDGVGQEGYLHAGGQGPLGVGGIDPADYGAAIKEGFAPPPSSSWSVSSITSSN
jgi:hypothetical protein